MAANGETEPRKSCNDNVGSAARPRRSADTARRGQSWHPVQPAEPAAPRRSELSRVQEDLSLSLSLSLSLWLRWRIARARDGRWEARGGEDVPDARFAAGVVAVSRRFQINNCVLLEKIRLGWAWPPSLVRLIWRREKLQRSWLLRG